MQYQERGKMQQETARAPRHTEPLRKLGSRSAAPPRNIPCRSHEPHHGRRMVPFTAVSNHCFPENPGEMPESGGGVYWPVSDGRIRFACAALLNQRSKRVIVPTPLWWHNCFRRFWASRLQARLGRIRAQVGRFQTGRFRAKLEPNLLEFGPTLADSEPKLVASGPSSAEA